MTEQTIEQTPRQFCRKGVHSCVPAVTLTFDGGARRLYWCAEHATDADQYRSDADQAYDPGPVPPPTEQDRLIAQRIRAIAAIHAIAQWLTDHPDAPTPHTVSVCARPNGSYYTPDAERVAALDRFAAGHDAERYALNRHEYGKVHLAAESSHGVDITYTVSTTRREWSE